MAHPPFTKTLVDFYVVNKHLSVCCLKGILKYTLVRYSYSWLGDPKYFFKLFSTARK